jgi:peptidoglycan/xylan/chitin deacetylase (PgdA/CDA1 family)
MEQQHKRAGMSWKNQASIWSDRLGVRALLSALPKRAALIVFNYHRIGDSQSTLYDPDVFSATGEALEDQIGFLKKNLPLIGLEEAVGIATGKRSLTTALGLITFDDGYKDNYDLAFPILRSHNVPGAFFLVTSYVGSAFVPWWDEIAYIAKQSTKDRVRLEYPEEIEFEDVQANAIAASRRLAGLYKRPGVDGEKLLVAIADRFDAPRAGESADRLFLNWDEAREMVRGGMNIASHTHTHRILSKLTEEQQYTEAADSKRMLEERLGIRVETMAYPVGLQSSFSTETAPALTRAGYCAAFSFYGGLNRPGHLNPFDILRCGIGPCRGERFRTQVSLTALTGENWF